MIMKRNRCRQFSIKLLIMYLISTLLFLSSIDLHIHTDKAAATEDHGFCVSITRLTSNLLNFDTTDEIEVSPDGMLEVQHSVLDMLAIFLLLALVVSIFRRILIAGCRDAYISIKVPFYCTPPLRAPPL